MGYLLLNFTGRWSSRGISIDNSNAWAGSCWTGIQPTILTCIIYTTTLPVRCVTNSVYCSEYWYQDVYIVYMKFFIKLIGLVTMVTQVLSTIPWWSASQHICHAKVLSVLKTKKLVIEVLHIYNIYMCTRVFMSVCFCQTVRSQFGWQRWQDWGESL